MKMSLGYLTPLKKGRKTYQEFLLIPINYFANHQDRGIKCLCLENQEVLA